MFNKNYKENTCWWCSSSTNKLTGEHKFKRTDIERIFGDHKSIEKENLVRIVGGGERKGQIKSSKSKNLKFEQNICFNCNGNLSRKMDIAYDDFREYFVRNKNEIKQNGYLKLSEIYVNSYEGFSNLKRYIVKHICCYLVESKRIQPPENLIKFLNNEEELIDVKIIFRLKPYNEFYQNPNISIPYKSTLNIIEKSDFTGLFRIEAMFGWFTLDQLSFTYLIEKGISKSENFNNVLKLDIVNYKNSQLIKSSILDDLENISFLQDFYEYYPFAENKIGLYHYLKNNC